MHAWAVRRANLRVPNVGRKEFYGIVGRSDDRGYLGRPVQMRSRTGGQRKLQGLPIFSTSNYPCALENARLSSEHCCFSPTLKVWL